MKILEVKTDNKIEAGMYKFIENMDDRIEINFPIYADDDTYTTIVVDNTDYIDLDDTDTEEVTKLLTDLRECVHEIDDTSVFGSEENYICVIDTLETEIEDLFADYMVDDAIGEDDLYDRYEECDEEDDEENHEDEDPVLIIRTTTGDVYHTAYDSINWQYNAERVDDIEETITDFQTMIAEMYAGKCSIDDVSDTAEAVLNNMSVDTFYVFPMAKDISNREMALIKMFDAYAAYSTIFTHSAVKRNEFGWMKGYDDLLKRFKELLEMIKDNIDPENNINIPKARGIIDDVLGLIESCSVVKKDVCVNEEYDEAVQDLMNAFNEEGGDEE